MKKFLKYGFFALIALLLLPKMALTAVSLDFDTGVNFAPIKPQMFEIQNIIAMVFFLFVTLSIEFLVVSKRFKKEKYIRKLLKSVVLVNFISAPFFILFVSVGNYFLFPGFRPYLRSQTGLFFLAVVFAVTFLEFFLFHLFNKKIISLKQSIFIVSFMNLISLVLLPLVLFLISILY